MKTVSKGPQIPAISYNGPPRHQLAKRSLGKPGLPSNRYWGHSKKVVLRPCAANSDADTIKIEDPKPDRPSYYDNGTEEAELDGGNGGSDGKNIKYTGGNGGGGGGPPGSSNDDEGSPSLFWYFKAFFSMVVTVATYILLSKMAASKQESGNAQKVQSNALQAKFDEELLLPTVLRSDLQTLKRLQREAFEQLYTINRQMSLNKSTTGESRDGAGTKWTTFLKSFVFLPAPLGKQHNQASEASDESLNTAGEEQKQSEVLDFRIRGESWSKDKSLGVLAECSVPGVPEVLSEAAEHAVASAGQFSKLVATWKIRPGLKLVAPLVAGRGDDIVVTLNPQAGFGTTDCLRNGSDCHRQCRGKGLGAIMSNNKFGLSIAHLFERFHGSTRFPSHPADSATLLQAAGSLKEDIMLGCHILQTRKQPFRPERSGSNFSESEPLDEPLSEVLTTTQHRAGVTGAWNIGDKQTLSGWISLPVDRKAAGSGEDLDFGITCGSVPFPGQNGWAVSAGRSADTKTRQQSGRGYVAEAMLRLYPDDRLLLTPSLIGLVHNGKPLLGLALQTEWQL